MKPVMDLMRVAFFIDEKEKERALDAFTAKKRFEHKKKSTYQLGISILFT